MRRAIVIFLVLVLVPLLYAQDYSDWNTEEYFETATVESVKRYLDAGADVNARSEYGYTPLHDAARWNENPEIITVLLKAGANIEARNEYGYTPLHWAAVRNENPEIITVLLKAGANEARGEYGNTLLHDAARSNENPEIITTLLDAGADPKAKSDFGKTAWDNIQDNEELKNTDAYWRLNDLQY